MKKERMKGISDVISKSLDTFRRSRKGQKKSEKRLPEKRRRKR